MIRVGVIGGAGYTAGELIRLLINHSEIEIAFIHSTSNAGNHVASVHKDLIGETDLKFSDSTKHLVDVVFLCMGHGQSKTFLEEHPLEPEVKIIDLSQDFRLEGESGFVYGLPELNHNAIRIAKKVANPGCFATCIQLALLPLAASAKLQSEIHVNAITGSTGAGQKATDTTHFSWRNNNISVYKAFEHQHLKEIRQSLLQLQPNFNEPVNFIPWRGNFTRGIMASVYTKFQGKLDEAIELYESYYQDHPFTVISKDNPDLKQVVNTNKAILYLQKFEDKLLIISAIDNLLKGASGQALQNLNLMYSLPETKGLKLKATAF